MYGLIIQYKKYKHAIILNTLEYSLFVLIFRTTINGYNGLLLLLCNTIIITYKFKNRTILPLKQLYFTVLLDDEEQTLG